MYSDHVPLIREHAEASPQGLADVLTFALLSARVQFWRLDDQMQSVRKLGKDSPALWGWKREGYLRVQTSKLALHAMEPWQLYPTYAMETVIANIPGLGLAKGGFVCQMLGQPIACLDVRNRDVLGLPERFFREFRRDRNGDVKVSPKRFRERVEQYIATCQNTGGAEYWWNRWCNDTAARLGTTGEEISAEHVRIITGKRAPITKT